MKITPETKIQQEAFNWFQNKYCLKHHTPRLFIHSVPNGIPVHLPSSEMARALDLMSKTGMVKGVSDLIIHGINGRCINAECKTITGIQSLHQEKIQTIIQELGGVYFVFHSLDEFKEKINININWLLEK